MGSISASLEGISFFSEMSISGLTTSSLTSVIESVWASPALMLSFFSELSTVGLLSSTVKDS
ncbi:MAG: hypothetical protein ACTSPQ_16690 [Candidatus Helarchaeota archaeon]